LRVKTLPVFHVRLVCASKDGVIPEGTGFYAQMLTHAYAGVYVCAALRKLLVSNGVLKSLNDLK
jgi:hypothetical protein